MRGRPARPARLPRVLVIEDDTQDFELVRRLLDPLAWSVVHATRLAEALHLLAVTRVDVVLLDSCLPDARGIDAVRRIAARFPDVAIAVLAGSNEEELSLPAVHEGAQEYLVKEELGERALARSLSLAIERHRAETAVACLAAIVESSDAAVLRCTREGRIASWNRGAERLFGLPAAAASGRSFADLLAPDRRSEARALFAGLGRARASAAFEAPCVHVGGGALHVSFTLSPIRDRLGGVVGISVVGRDVTRQKELEAEVLALSLRDELTGLYNRRGFVQLAQQQMKLARRTGRGMVLLFVDLDRLKAINDHFGHVEGDRALVDTAVILKRTFRETSVIARIGGDEFVVLLADAAPSSGPALAARLQRNVSRHNAHAGRPVDLSISVGTAFSPARGRPSIEALWARADAAMYRTKPPARA
jgi:diguanylate cyclase (GGDEF)-like protein/PAS domain S-box-containing protein